MTGTIIRLSGKKVIELLNWSSNGKMIVPTYYDIYNSTKEHKINSKVEFESIKIYKNKNFGWSENVPVEHIWETVKTKIVAKITCLTTDVDWMHEMEKCRNSLYYFFTKYACNSNGIKYETNLTESEFNLKFNQWIAKENQGTK